MKQCLYCNQKDSGLKNKYSPGNNIDFVCSGCVILLCDTDQKELKYELDIAIEKNFANKITALKMFIEPEENVNVRPNEKRLKRDYDRAGSFRPDQFKKKHASRFAKQ